MPTLPASSTRMNDIERLLGALEDCRQPDEGDPIMGTWSRGYNAALRVACQVVKAEAELSRYAAEMRVERPVMVRAAALADAADWTPSIDADYPR